VCSLFAIGGVRPSMWLPGGAALESGAVLWSLGGIKYAERKFGLAYRENLEA